MQIELGPELAEVIKLLIITLSALVVVWVVLR